MHVLSENKLMNKILPIFLLFMGCSSPQDEIINVEIYDYWGYSKAWDNYVDINEIWTKGMSIGAFKDDATPPKRPQESDYKTRGVVSVSEILNWEKMSNGHWKGSKGNKSVSTIDLQGAKAVSSYMK